MNDTELAEIERLHAVATDRSTSGYTTPVLAASAEILRQLPTLVAALNEVCEQRDLRATQVEEALSIVQQFSIRLDDFMLDELLSVLDDGPCDDEMGRVIPSPLRVERDVAVARLTAAQALVEGHEICSDWRFVDNLRAALGDAS